MDDRHQLWSSRAPQQYHLQNQPGFLLPRKSPFTSRNTPALTHLIHSALHSAPSTGARLPQLTAPQIQLEEHHPSYTRPLPFPQQQRYVPDGQVHQHAQAQRRPYPMPHPGPNSPDHTPGPSHTSAEDDADDYPNGTTGDSADSNVSESHEREGRLAPQGGEDLPIDEEPLYVNAKQYNRILKRRVARARLEELHRLSRQRKVRLRCRILDSHADFRLLLALSPRIPS